MLGLPHELFDAVKHVVIDTRSTGGYTVKKVNQRISAAEWSKRQADYKAALLAARLAGKPTSSVPRPSAYELVNIWMPVRKSEPHGVLLLNWVHDMIHAMGYEYKGMNNNGSFVLEYTTTNWFDANGKWYSDFVDTFSITINSTGDCYVYQNDNQNEQVYSINGVLTVVDRETIAAESKTSVEKVNLYEQDFWSGKVRDPQTHLCSIFPRWSEDGSEFATYINGIRHDIAPKVSALVNEAGQKYSDYDVNMAALNSCEVPADHKDAESMGNFGECADAWFETEEEAKSFTFQYDLSKPVAVKSFSVEFSAANGTPNGHYNRFSAYYDLKENKVIQ